MKPLSLFLLVGGALAAAKPTVFFIRHGEKPSSHDNPTLSPRGKKRAQCIRSVFGDDSDFDIGYILAEKPKKSQYSMPNVGPTSQHEAPDALCLLLTSTSCSLQHP